MWLAYLETPNFRFVALDKTLEDARETVMKGWRRHCEQMKANHDYVTEDDVTLAPIQPGDCLRDWSVIR